MVGERLGQVAAGGAVGGAAAEATVGLERALAVAAGPAEAMLAGLGEIVETGIDATADSIPLLVDAAVILA